MNYTKNIAFIALLIVSQTIFAKNKPQIFFSNEYGDAVTVKVSWKSNNFPYLSTDEIINLREHDKNLGIKAPYSFYKLIGISATPKSMLEENNNIVDYDQDFEVPLVAVNEDILTDKHVQNQNYFIVKASPKDSAVPGQKKIYIKGYQSQQKYADEIVKAEKEQKSIAQSAIPVAIATPIQEPANQYERIARPAVLPTRQIETQPIVQNVPQQTSVNPGNQNELAEDNDDNQDAENFDAHQNISVYNRQTQQQLPAQPVRVYQSRAFENREQRLMPEPYNQRSQYIAPARQNPMALSHPFWQD